jgi:hypothetical protein
VTLNPAGPRPRDVQGPEPGPACNDVLGQRADGHADHRFASFVDDASGYDGEFPHPHLHVRRSPGLSFATTLMLLLAVAVVASWHPARRASSVDPAVALRD